jgi:hypothetical protein
LDSSTRRLGGWASILTGITYAIFATVGPVLPPEQQLGASTEAFLLSLAEDSTGFRVALWVGFVGAIFALAAVPAITGMVRQSNEGLARWAATLATGGFLIIALDLRRTLALLPEEASAFGRVDEDFREVILGDNLHLPLDPERWVSFGTVGFWLLVVGILALRDRRLPPPLGYLAVATGVSHWLIVLGDELELWMFSNLAFGGRIVLGAVFFIWVGRFVFQSPAPASYAD